ncbi:SDR family oxidoreductase [Pelagicoccus sp. SDUM812002]|uniref:SDR family oxidoreductase n=1 Tax=Pelagicoccus sp. SDUM812002 TaxID=3041266 RepID=UPI00280E31B1|nr:SDR family oxidoreductase [Pelagicoccus sp. SDUM812002]MDQ8185828.1 SDR family oxidoreductase [Pelagicoccus sp. SDUM812002]
MSLPIKNSVAFVTGSNRGIGRAIVEALLERGAKKVYAAARNISSLDSLASSHPGRVVPVALDVTNADQITDVQKIAPDVNLLVNNAGYAVMKDTFAVSDEDARALFEINYWGPFNLTRAFAPAIVENGGGIIVNIASVVALTNFPFVSSYSDSKAAVHSLVSGTRLQLADKGVTVMGVYPGPVDTDMAKDVPMEKSSPQDVAAEILDGIESGADEVFPDPFAKTFAAAYFAGHKALELQVAASAAQEA